MERFLKLVLFGFLIMSSELPNYFSVVVSYGPCNPCFEDLICPSHVESALVEALKKELSVRKQKVFFYGGEGDHIIIGDVEYKCDHSNIDFNQDPPLKTLNYRNVDKPDSP